MSGAPKRGTHEEGVHSSSSLMRPGEEEGNPSFPRLNYGAVQDTRPGYLPRPESHDGDRRSPLHSVYKMPSSVVTDTPYGSHSVSGPEIRADLRDPKDVRENKGVESVRDSKVETREVLAKPEKESRVDESKEVKYDKGEVKVDKEVYGAGGNHSNWKEQHRVKKHPDVPTGAVMTGYWMGPPQVRKYDTVKHASTTFVRKETDEAMGENRVDLKGDKERKRKEGKHHEWPESDKDYKSNVQVGGGTSSSTNNELKEVIREDKPKEKEKPEEREIGGEKEEMADKTPVQENLGSEQKKPSESWRNMEREAKERRRERDGDIEGERPEKRIRGNDKDSEEGGADVDLSADRDRDGFGYSVQQRKRMLRPRGSPQVGNRDGRFKSRGQDGEG